MTWWQAVLLGALQGVTEFLPISSSGHLVLVQHYLGFGEETGNGSAALFFDGVLHFGTVIAVLVYFRRGLRQQLAQPIGDTHSERKVWPATWSDVLQLAFLVGLATLPAAVATVVFSDQIVDSFNNPNLVAVNFLILGFILLITDRLQHGDTVGPATRWWQALLVGVGQAISAVSRGLSRSGMTISAALGVGLQRDWAVRFSFLMSVVASIGLGGLGILKALGDPDAGRWLTPQFLWLTVSGAAVSAIVGYLTIDPLIRLVQRAQLWWFSAYLWLVGGATLTGEWLRH